MGVGGGDGRGVTLNTSSAVSLRLILTTHKLRSGSSILSSTSELVWLFSCKCSKSCRSNNRLYSACIFIQTNTTINLNLMHYKGMFWPDQLLVRPGTPACNHTLQLPVQHKLHKEKQSTNSTTTSDWPFYTWNCMIENDYPNSYHIFKGIERCSHIYTSKVKIKKIKLLLKITATFHSFENLLKEFAKLSFYLKFMGPSVLCMNAFYEESLIIIKRKFINLSTKWRYIKQGGISRK